MNRNFGTCKLANYYICNHANLLTGSNCKLEIYFITAQKYFKMGEIFFFWLSIVNQFIFMELHSFTWQFS